MTSQIHQIPIARATDSDLARLFVLLEVVLEEATEVEVLRSSGDLLNVSRFQLKVPDLDGFNKSLFVGRGGDWQNSVLVHPSQQNKSAVDSVFGRQLGQNRIQRTFFDLSWHNWGQWGECLHQDLVLLTEVDDSWRLVLQVGVVLDLVDLWLVLADGEDFFENWLVKVGNSDVSRLSFVNELLHLFPGLFNSDVAAFTVEKRSMDQKQVHVVQSQQLEALGERLVRTRRRLGSSFSPALVPLVGNPELVTWDFRILDGLADLHAGCVNFGSIQMGESALG
ncbi:hypothetical protein OGAPHI_004546 [Ogataea philodendri]|uniref:Uncharacterized protein n=1 Tax=Ogataea philodendri TaxID=1378263 RepID=A0A9P8P346_9ASCO|nr:uncharacterized protein OGAPHI_004546 [Ogataea philodendri]KAH3664195.1 hypothetical protein OGAPHI_004546 [Ogataea philodendri]